MSREHIDKLNRQQFRRLARVLASAVYEFPRKKFSLTGKYTVRPAPNQKKMKVLIVVAEPEKFDEELAKAIARSSLQDAKKKVIDVTRRKIVID